MPTDEDDINFFDDDNEADENTPADKHGEDSAQEYVSKDDYNKLLEEQKATKTEIAAMRQFKEDLSRVSSGNDQSDKTDYLNLLAKNPESFVNKIKEETLNEVRSQQNGTELVQEYKQKFPHLVNDMEYIGVEYQKLAKENQQSGKQMNDREMLDESIKRFTTKFNIRNPQDENRQREARRQAMNYQAGTGAPPSPTEAQVADKIWGMNDEQFEKVKRGLIRKFS